MPPPSLVPPLPACRTDAPAYRTCARDPQKLIELTSTTAYHTTVFLGGLSPLVSENTLVPLREVPEAVGKHYGFVQFLRKSDAEGAIEDREDEVSIGQESDQSELGEESV
ncbi:hypothetical protein MSAN_02276700 [Mycena sanguinolenta]|uniref:RRM domain-containing protein n=1 Tax=Mycena sanguinolenta TaxID=230812 RepID=A0A8H7CIJ0_9AGAR|nr:hypothetical protein MSAN_02276700 [Mycena sanguinolenta]